MLTIRSGIVVLTLLLSLNVNRISFSQVTENDSLIALLKVLPESKEKASVLKQLSILHKRSDLDLSTKYANEMLDLSRQIGYNLGIAYAFEELAYGMKGIGKIDEAINFQDSALLYFQKEEYLKGEGVTWNQLGVLNLSLNRYDTARVQFQKSLEVFQQLNDSANMANEYLNIGITYEMQGFYYSALDYFFKCLEIDEKLNYTPGIASDYMSIGLIFKKQNNYESAIEYYQKALLLSEEMKDEHMVASVLTNFGVASKDLKHYDTALLQHEKALSLFDKAKDKRGAATAYHNIAVVYFNLNDLGNAIKNLEQSQENASNLKSEYFDLVNDILLARIRFKQGFLSEAATIAEKASQQASSINVLAEKHEIVVLLSEIYEAAGKFDMALETTKKGIVLKDSLYTIEQAGQMQELLTKYETAEKENRIDLLSKEGALRDSELKRKSLQQNVLLAGVGVSGFIIFLVFRTYNVRQKQKQLLADKKLEVEKREAERLQELDEAKSRFFANIAHEFRTPLTLILGPAEQLIDDNEDSLVNEHASIIQLNANKLLTLINQLMDLSKLESGMVKLNAVQDDFIAFSKACVLSFQTLAEEKDIELKIQTEVNELLMPFDHEKMAIVFSNLIFNAIKFTNPFGEINVLLSIPKDVGFGIEVQITDTGIGIAESQIPYIFDRFYQVDDSYSRKTQGTGIGLALSKELVELHGGKIAVISQENKGACFILQFPILPIVTEGNIRQKPSINLSENGKQADVKILQKVKEESFATNLGGSQEFTLLVVEDNPDVRKFIIDIVKPFYRVLEAENGKIGCDMALEQIPDLIISDVMMPEMDGFELCKNLKDDERTSHIPIIILTAKAGIDSKIEGLGQGADDYLDKPFNARELLARVKNLIKIRKQLQLKYGETLEASLFAPKEDAFLTKLKGVIEERIDQEEFNVVELGKLLAMSRTQVHRKLKALTGLSTSRFIRQYKLEKAHKLLHNDQYNVSEIAYMLGFNTANYFSTCFHEQYGYPPSEITKKVIKKS